MLDAVVPRAEMKAYIARSLEFFLHSVSSSAELSGFQSGIFIHSATQSASAKFGLEITTALGGSALAIRTVRPLWFVHVAGTNGRAPPPP